MKANPKKSRTRNYKVPRDAGYKTRPNGRSNGKSNAKGRTPDTPAEKNGDAGATYGWLYPNN